MKQHPLKQSCNGLPVVTVPLVLFSDDTSGNRSKKWNKFDYWSMTLAGLPIREARSFHNMYFFELFQSFNSSGDCTPYNRRCGASGKWMCNV